MGDELPLDVPFATAAEWLAQRRVIPSTYLKSLRAVQAKVATALEAERPEVSGLAAILPAAQLQEGLTYFDCKEVFQLLQDAGRGEKNFLGSYSDPYTARWADICRRFENGNIFLADAAACLSQACNYELPALKAELNRAEKELSELQRRQGEYTRLAEASQQRFVDECARRRLTATDGDRLLSISRGDIGEKLRASLQQLRPLFVSVTRLCQQPALRSATELYRGFVALSLQGGADGSADETACIAMLGRMQELSLEALSKEAEEAAAAQELNAAALAGAGGGVDWGDDDAAPAAPVGGFDWGDDDATPAAPAVPAGGFDWGDDDAAPAAPAAGGVNWSDDDAEPAAPAAGGVNWGDDDAAPAAPAGGFDWGDEEVAAPAGGGVDWGDDAGGDDAGAGGWDGVIEIESGGESASAFEIFEDDEHRDALLDNLYELRGFLEQRLAETSTGAQDGLPAALQLDKDELAAQLALVRDVCGGLDDEHARHLLLLQGSGRYFERMESALMQLLNHATKMRNLAEEMHARQAELALTMKDVYPKHQVAVTKAKKLKAQFEAALSAHFQGRRVNLMGMVC